MDGYTRKRPATSRSVRLSLEPLEDRFLLSLSTVGNTSAPDGPSLMLAQPSAGAHATDVQTNGIPRSVGVDSSAKAIQKQTIVSAKAGSQTPYNRTTDVNGRIYVGNRDSSGYDDDDADDSFFNEASIIVRLAESEPAIDLDGDRVTLPVQSGPTSADLHLQQVEYGPPPLSVEMPDPSALLVQNVVPSVKPLMLEHLVDSLGNLPEPENQTPNNKPENDQVLISAIEQLPDGAANDRLLLAGVPLAGELVLDLQKIEQGVEAFFARLSPGTAEGNTGSWATTTTYWLTLVATAALEIALLQDKTLRTFLSSTDRTGSCGPWPEESV